MNLASNIMKLDTRIELNVDIFIRKYLLFSEDLEVT